MGEVSQRFVRKQFVKKNFSTIREDRRMLVGIALTDAELWRQIDFLA
jgi:hypothetical protein